VGKSVIFGLLTGKYVTVSNYPGTTVEVTSGNISLDGKRLVLIDTPGVNSLVPMSEDEKVTRDILLSECPSAVVQVGDAKNLKRTLLITLQIAEMGLPMTLDLNMIDEAMDKGITIDVDILKGLLGIDIVSTIAPQKKGIKELREAMLSPQRAAVRLSYGPIIEEYISKISRLLPQTGLSKRSIAVMILSEDESLKDWLHANVRSRDLAEIEHLRHECLLKAKESPAYLINKKRIEVSAEIALKVVKKNGPFGRGIIELHRQRKHAPCLWYPCADRGALWTI